MPTPGSTVAVGNRHGKIAANAEGREGSSVQIVPAIELSCLGSCLCWAWARYRKRVTAAGVLTGDGRRKGEG
jgi:hypothetical protein